MTQARKTLVCVEQTPFYHCVGRCVRRAFLCGDDKFTGRSFEHRREWMRERIALLGEIFAVDICAYALMSNHYHLVVQLCPEQVSDLSDFDIIDRWQRIFAGPLLVHRYRAGEVLSRAELNLVTDILARWRERLADLSWFMRCLNEYIARRANREDGVTGHFWEARFKSQALLDEIALLRGMVYTDLNPIRAAMATSIEESDYTSAQQRFRDIIEKQVNQSANALIPKLAVFRSEDETRETPLPFSLTDYMELVDVTGRCCVQGKRGFIGEKVPRVLNTLNINPEQWLDSIQNRSPSAGRAIGSPSKLRQFAERLKQQWMHGMAWSAELYPP